MSKYPAKVILDAAESMVQFEPHRLYDSSRTEEVCAVRAALIYALRHHTWMSLPEITRLVRGKKTLHSTAISCIKRCERKHMDTYEELHRRIKFRMEAWNPNETQRHGRRECLSA